MFKYIVFFCVLALTASAADPEDLFNQAENLARQNQNEKAMQKIEQAVTALERLHAADQDISWQGRNGLRFAARLAREDFLDYDKALAFSDKLFELADNDYWRVPARLDRALTYRAMGDFQKAQHEYDVITQMEDERYRNAAMLPQAEMVYFDQGKKERGRKMILDALMNASINSRERFNTLRQCAEQAMTGGNRKKALKWYALLETMPIEKKEERARYLSQTWYEMGKIHESLGQTEQAKEHYRNAMNQQQGEMRYRTRARNALESMEYFE
jgi:tetratricopeptide (TPR) repeat protein